jgi:hypothetical protein
MDISSASYHAYMYIFVILIDFLFLYKLVGLFLVD